MNFIEYIFTLSLALFILLSIDKICLELEQVFYKSLHQYEGILNG